MSISACALIVIATLHTGFQFGWNVHTLAYVLMMLVILSGMFGIAAYVDAAAGAQQQSRRDDPGADARQRRARRSPAPRRRAAARPDHADLVLAALAQDPFGGGLIARLSGRYRRCATRGRDGFNRPTLPEHRQSIRSSASKRCSAAQVAARPLRRHMRIRGDARSLALCPRAGDLRAARGLDRAYHQRLLLLDRGRRGGMAFRLANDRHDG